MYIINITYKVDLKEVDQFIEQHVSFLDEQYVLGNFLASGRKVPRTGGVILSNIKSKSQLEQVINKDPFKENEIADYDIIEFIPSKTCDELSFLAE